MRPLVTYPDAERIAVDDLTADIADLDETATVGVGVPADWTRDSDPHLQLAIDGTSDDHPIAQRHTLRVTARARDATEAKRVAHLAHGLLLARHQYRALTGIFTTRDPDSGAELASFTVRATVRSIPID